MSKTPTRVGEWNGYSVSVPNNELINSPQSHILAGLNYRFSALTRSDTHPHLKDGTVYRQVRPTRLDKIKNFPHEVRGGGVIGRLSDYTPEGRRCHQASARKAGAFPMGVLVPTAYRIGIVNLSLRLWLCATLRHFLPRGLSITHRRQLR